MISMTATDRVTIVRIVKINHAVNAGASSQMAEELAAAQSTA